VTWEEDEPTNPRASEPPPSGPIGLESMTVPSLVRSDATQLAEIITAWENADDQERVLLTEFAKRLTRPPSK
jgi:hypothetical protein